MLGLTDRPLALAAVLLVAACASDDPAPAETDGASTGTEAGSTTAAATEASDTVPDPTAADGSSSGADTSGGEVLPADPAEFFTALSGLWVAPVTSWTSAGSFPTMNMDVRAASDGVLFSRVDFDPDNALRFAFAIEDHDGVPQLTYRNGGYFLGLLRDTRTVLESVEGDVWRFCALGGAGCGYVDARFDFSTPDTMRLDVDVMGTPHIEWNAVRREARALEGSFPHPPTQPGDADFPPMPQLDIQATWNEPLAEAADVWVVLSTTPCGINPVANCAPSRYMRAEAEAGSTSVVLTLEQIHAGSYSANAVLDRNRNIAAGILLPDTGDAISWPLDVGTTVPETGTGQLDLMLNTEF